MRALSMRPAWFEDAKCHATDDPSRWDADSGDDRGYGAVEGRILSLIHI